MTKMLRDGVSGFRREAFGMLGLTEEPKNRRTEEPKNRGGAPPTNAGCRHISRMLIFGDVTLHAHGLRQDAADPS